MMFLDKNKPIHTCTAKDCDGCIISEKLVCHFNIGQLLTFILMSIPILFLAGVFIYQYNPSLLLFWIFIIISYFGFIEIRVMCSHCPHYAEPEIISLKCWANYGSAKLWKYRPGPMTLMENVIFYLGLIIIFIVPITFAVLLKSYFLSSIYALFLIGLKSVLNIKYCNHCINFSCPFNKVDEAIKNEFFNKNISVRDAWIN